MNALIFVAWLCATATAQSDEPPLAVPIDAVPMDAVSPEQPLAIPGEPSRDASVSSAQRLQALRQYRRERLSINPEVEVTGGGTRVYGNVGFGFGFPGFGTGIIVTDPIQTYRTYGAYQGAKRLDVPNFLGTTGASDLQGQVLTDIRTAERRSRICYVTAGVGVVGMIVSSIGARSAQNAEQYYRYTSALVPSLGLTVGGFVVGSFPAARAQRLRRYPSESIGIDQAQELADQHNEQLRNSLGLSPEDVWDIEAAESPTR